MKFVTVDRIPDLVLLQHYQLKFIIMEFEIWHIWLIASIIFFLLEIFIPSFVVFNLGVGAIFATGISALGAGLEWQILVFSLFTLLSFFLIRPLLKRWAYKRSDQKQTNVYAMIGRRGVVTEMIDESRNSGLVKIDGDIWQARTNAQQIIDRGKAVRVTAIDSIVLIVEEAGIGN